MSDCAPDAVSQIHGMYRDAAAEVRNRLAGSGLRSSHGHQSLARVDMLYASAVARKVALGQVLQLLGVEPESEQRPSGERADP